MNRIGKSNKFSNKLSRLSSGPRARESEGRRKEKHFQKYLIFLYRTYNFIIKFVIFIFILWCVWIVSIKKEHIFTQKFSL